jgi:hypothetical protein
LAGGLEGQGVIKKRNIPLEIVVKVNIGVINIGINNNPSNI